MKIKLILEEINKEKIKKDVQIYIEKLTNYHKDRDKKQGYSLPSSVFEANYGPNKIRIVAITYGGKGQKSAFCFIDYDGNLYKAASWNAPAKGIRGSIYDQKPPLDAEDFYK